MGKGPVDAFFHCKWVVDVATQFAPDFTVLGELCDVLEAEVCREVLKHITFDAQVELHFDCKLNEAFTFEPQDVA